jgi:FMN reductase
MAQIVTIAGSPSLTSRSSALLVYLRDRAEGLGFSTAAIGLNDVNPTALLYADFEDETIRRFNETVAAADVVVIGTPVYKASYTGALKALLDVLPQNALRGKPILPLATGGSPAHFLVLDYALKPVLSALGASYILQGIYVQDSQLQVHAGEPTYIHPDIEVRLHDSLNTLVNVIDIHKEKV